MKKFEERMKTTLALIDPPETSGEVHRDPFKEVLNDFAAALMKGRRYVGASIKDNLHTCSLITWPRLRPDERSIMLTFWREGPHWKTSTDSHSYFERDFYGPLTPALLEDYLFDYFLRRTAFPSTLAEYHRRCQEPVDGYLRVGDLLTANTSDIFVEVPNDAQWQIADAAPGKELDLLVKLETTDVGGRYRATGKYRFLYSGGFGLKLATHKHLRGKIQLTGTVQLPDDH